MSRKLMTRSGASLCLFAFYQFGTPENNEVNWKVFQFNLLKAILQNVLC